MSASISTSSGCCFVSVQYNLTSYHDIISGILAHLETSCHLVSSVVTMFLKQEAEHIKRFCAFEQQTKAIIGRPCWPLNTVHKFV